MGKYFLVIDLGFKKKCNSMQGDFLTQLGDFFIKKCCFFNFEVYFFLKVFY